MKKIIPLFLLLIVVLPSCEDTSLNNIEKGQPMLENAEIKNGILSFETIEAYRAFIDEAPAEKKENFIFEISKAAKYTSLLKKCLEQNLGTQQEQVIANNNKFLSSILNENGLIAIGDYIFRIDLSQEKVYVLNKRFEDQLNDLEQGNTENKNVLVFDTSDDVLSLIESGNLHSSDAGRAMLCLSESGADSKSDKHEEIVLVTKTDCPNLVMNADMKHVYQKAGIYFSLMLELKYMWKRADCGTLICYSPLNTDISATVTYRYKQKCKSNDTGYQTASWSVLDDNKLNQRLWESANALHLYYLDTQFTWNHVGYDPGLPKPGANDDLPYFFTKLGNRTYHLEPISDNI